MSKEKTQSEDIVVNLDSFAVPAAIVLAGVIIAATIFFTNKGNDTTAALGDTSDDTSQVQEDEFAATSTTISDSPYLGNKDKAKVAIVEFTDYQCPYCKSFNDDTMSDLIKNYVDSGDAIYVFRDFPLDFHGQIAIDSANAAACVNEIAGIDDFVKFHSAIFEIESVDDLSKAASGLGVDMNKYDKCMTEERYVEKVNKDITDGVEAGVQGTPGFVLGVLGEDGSVKGKLVAGAYPYDTFKTILDELLK